MSIIYILCYNKFVDILQVKNLSKRFGSFNAVDDVSFELKEGEILGFLGRNGAGKTTTIQMLLGVLKPTSGDIVYFGKSLFKHREEILEEVNFSSTYTSLPWNLSVFENFHYLSYLYDIKDRRKRIKEIIEIFQLEELEHKQVRDLSAGQTTRVNLAKAFLNFPKVLLLDEPTASLDPDIAQYIREILVEQRNKFQVSILLTSHNMAEVEQVSDRVVFIEKGKIIADDIPENLAKTIEISHIELYITRGVEAIIELCEKGKITYLKEGKRFRINVKEKHISEFLRTLAEHDIIFTEISIEKPTLEDYFLEMTKEQT